MRGHSCGCLGALLPLLAVFKCFNQGGLGEFATAPIFRSQAKSFLIGLGCLRRLLGKEGIASGKCRLGRGLAVQRNSASSPVEELG